jgi:UDP-N-acetylglucosamine 2-epimerase (non-hydrolysing)
MLTVLSIFGTRPEAIKMAPVIKAIEKHPDGLKSLVCVTAQHRQMLDQVLNLFTIKPDYDLDIMRPKQDLFDVTTEVLAGLKSVLNRERPDIVLVHGDTTTTMAAAIASFYGKIKVAHVEAGLRTHNKFAPFPEEMNRRVVTAIADFHFAPTAGARGNLLNEGVPPETVFVTGNTVIDALLYAKGMIDKNATLRSQLDAQFSFLDRRKKLVLVTGHRRENFGKGFEDICRALVDLAKVLPEVEILYPAHLNPQVQEPVNRILGGEGLQNIHLIAPVDYLPFVYLISRSYLIITDSGGLQEEAPSLGKPVLVMRETTERPEAVTAGTVKLVGTDREKIAREATILLQSTDAYHAMSQVHNPYGDGKAAERIVEVLLSLENDKC